MTGEPGRRRFLKAAAGTILGAGAATGLYTWRVEPHWLEITRRELPLRGLPPDLVGRTLAHLSDLHVGPRVDDGYIVSTFRTVAALEPDIVVVTGDFISYRTGQEIDRLRSVLASFPRGRLATVAILGNHDYGTNWSMAPVADAVTRAAADAGITVLRNHAVDVAGLRLIGLDDLWAGRFSTDPLADLERGRDGIVLSHNPDTVDRPGWERFTGWILAGHTHGGQCKPPFLPPPLLPVRNRRYTSGAFDVAPGRNLYISRGVGHLIRVRFNCRPEVAMFRLARTT